MGWESMADGVLTTTIKTFKLDLQAVYTPLASPGTPVSLNVVWDRPNHNVDPQTGAPVHSTGPQAGIRLADLSFAPMAGDMIAIKGVNYQILDFIEDGQGGAELMLKDLS